MNNLSKIIHHPQWSKEILADIGQFGEAKSTPVYVVGGYLRDCYLRRFTKDIDIVVIGDGVIFAREFAHKHGLRKPVSYPHFGTASLNVQGIEVEFVTAREESYRKESRNPTVKKTDLTGDLRRRDFTINTLVMPLWGAEKGALIDLLGAREDLHQKVIRTPLDPLQTFEDDPLRIMRAIRFAAQFRFTIESQTFEAIIKKKERLIIVSQERITDEFLKILGSPKPSVGFLLMKESGVLEQVLPELNVLSGVEQREKFHHKDVFLHTLKVVDNVAKTSSNILLRFTALMHDIAKPLTKKFIPEIGWTFYGHEELGARMLETIVPRMRLSREFLDYSQKLVRLHLRPINLADEEVTDSAIRRLIVSVGEHLEDLLTLCRADITSSNPHRAKNHLENFNIVARHIEEVREKDRLSEFKSPVTGNEIMEVCGIPPGKPVGILKSMIEEAILEGIIPNDHDPAFDYLRKIKDEVLEQFKNTSAHSPQ